MGKLGFCVEIVLLLYERLNFTMNWNGGIYFMVLELVKITSAILTMVRKYSTIIIDLDKSVAIV